MTKQADLLIEILTEELPPKALLKLAKSFHYHIQEGLKKANLSFKNAEFFATPRRLSVLVHDLDATQEDQEVERKGPAVSAAFDSAGNPTKACMGFASSLGVSPKDLIRIKNPQGEWVGYKQKVTGKSLNEIVPSVIEQAISALPIPKRMRWGDGEAQFVRPIHAVIILYGDKIIPAQILGKESGRITRGHRFLSPDWITIPSAASYTTILQTEGYVVADFDKRRQIIKDELMKCAASIPDKNAQVVIPENLLDEVTGLVEWPVALYGRFDKDFLMLPQEVLISAMEDHQRYFPLVDKENKLLPYFITISNIQSHDMSRVTHGNERVLRARLADAAFFYNTDQKESLYQRLERLKGVLFQAKLGTLYDKAERLSKLAAFIGKKIKADTAKAERAGWLAKTDLTTNMVGEFPELQGVMGYYYAIHDGEDKEVALAMKEQYLPRFSGDNLPNTTVGQALAIADRMDNLIASFGINHIPTGDKDPYGLRRAAIGILRMLIENKINLDLKESFEFALSNFKMKLENPEIIPQVLNFMQERLRAWYQEQGTTSDVFASVAALGITNPLDVHERIKAVEAFKKLSEAETLSIANKRVSNILTKYEDTIDAKTINPDFFETAVEKELAQQLEAKSKIVNRLSQSGKYDEVLIQLAELRKPIDDFFDQVMVMTDDKSKRENRILLLTKLRALFLQVADIALLQ